MRFRVLYAVAMAMALLGSSAWAQNANTALESIKSAFQDRFKGIEVAQVSATPVAGLYEVQIGLEVVYVDAEVNHVIQGRIIDATTQEDLTEARIQQLSAVSFDALPIDLAVKIVRGNGSQKIAIFEDPNCPYCKQLHKTLKDFDNVTIYSFLFPILSADSVTKSQNILCASDPTKALIDWMLNNKQPEVQECDNHNIQALLDAGRNLSVRGTPAIFFTDGSRASGALPAAQLKQRLDAAN